MSTNKIIRLLFFLYNCIYLLHLFKGIVVKRHLYYIIQLFSEKLEIYFGSNITISLALTTII